MSKGANQCFSWRFRLFSALVAISATSFADDFEKDIQLNRMPQSIGALGDSMTAGALANYRRQESYLPWVLLGLLSDALQYGATRSVRSIEQPKLSWATGSSRLIRSMPSHYNRLASMVPHKIHSYNASLSGAESQDVLDDQLEEMRGWSRRSVGQDFPDYVSLLIGANDLCAKSPDQMVQTVDYYANVEAVVGEILDASPNSKVVISSLPNVVKLREVAKNARDFLALRCEQVWKKVKLCPTLTTLGDPESREKLQNRLDQYNEALQEIVREQRERHGDRVRYAKHVYQEDFTSRELSVDCFHPNKEGQARLAESTFRDTWWHQEWVARRAQLKKEFLAEQKRQCPRPTGKGAHRPAICYERWVEPEPL